MNAIDGAIERLDRVEFGLFEAHLRRCQNSGGLVVLNPRLVFLGAAWDPVDGDDEHTLAVMYVHGDGSLLPELARLATDAGFTHLCWCREVCRGDGRLRKTLISECERLGKVMMRHG